MILVLWQGCNCNDDLYHVVIYLLRLRYSGEIASAGTTISIARTHANVQWSLRDSSDICEVSLNFQMVSIGDQKPFAVAPYKLFMSINSIVD